MGNKSIEEEKKSLAPKKAAIGFSYDDPEGAQNLANIPLPGKKEAEEKNDSGEDSDSDIDLGLLFIFIYFLSLFILLFIFIYFLGLLFICYLLCWHPSLPFT